MKAEYDILIVGGGIHGAGCAQTLAAAGYSVVVLEQYDGPGLGTSCKSSKLIHGGLRYLETFQLKLVYECLRERKLLLRNAPHLVTLEPFHIPIYQDSKRRPWQIRLGLIIYTLLSGVGFEHLSKARWKSLDGLETDGLQAVFKYYDGQTDDQRLTEAVMLSARELGAEFIPGAELISADCGQEICSATYLQDSDEHQLWSNIIINAAGPWANTVLQRISPRPPLREMELVLGTHIIVPGRLNKGMYYLEAPQDKRAVFVMPWHEDIMIGTTEIPFKQSPDKVEPPESDIEYLLEIYNHYFSPTISRDNVLRAFAGLRVLPADGGTPFGRSRDTLIYNDKVSPQVFTVYGGKMTAYRATAERMLKLVQKQLPGH